MNIGIDFDNTIAKYDKLFKDVAIEVGIIKPDWNGDGKIELRDELHKKSREGQTTWMKLQGLVYGKFMHRAELMPGAANFLLQCKLRKHTVFVVSHKTEFGHFDSEKILLRQKALDWMKGKKFFEPDYFDIKEENIYFAKTRKEKITKIFQLKCDYFIDDLPEIFEDSLFPGGTKKILIGYAENPIPDSAVKAFKSWGGISNHIHGSITLEDIKAWIKPFFDFPVEKIEKISGRGNSRIFKLTIDNKNYALKVYPDRSTDGRNRLKTEYAAIELLLDNGFTNIPTAVNKNDDLNVGLYSWVPGKTLVSPENYDRDKALEFVRQLYALSKAAKNSFEGIATEACLSYNTLEYQIDSRLKRLLDISVNQPVLRIFLDSYCPVWEKLKQQISRSWPKSSRENNLKAEYRILSPSDFGFHNALKNGPKITFIDFEYFGWDDPVKLAADFLWHPGMNLNSDIVENWKNSMVNIFSDDPDFKKRFKVSIPFYGMRWILILLNEFLPGFTQRRQNASQIKIHDAKSAQRNQLNKAERYLEQVRKISQGMVVT